MDTSRFSFCFSDAQDEPVDSDLIRKVNFIKKPDLKFDHELMKVPVANQDDLASECLYMTIEKVAEPVG